MTGRKSHFKDDAQREQFLNMIKQGSSAQQIIDFFKNTYQIVIPASTIYAAKCHLKKHGEMKPQHSAEKQPKRHYKKRGSVSSGAAALQVAPGGGTDEIKQLIDKLYAELDAFCAYIIKKVRIELVKRIAEARDKRIVAGEDVEPIEEEELHNAD